MYGVSIINKVNVKKTEISSSIVTEEQLENICIVGKHLYSFYQYGKLKTELHRSATL